MSESTPVAYGQLTNRGNKALLIAFHFPPFNNSTGYQRPFAAAKYLNRYGWEPLVLTAHARAYNQAEVSRSTNDLSTEYPVERALALDSVRDLSIRGKHAELLSVPDRYWTWLFDGLRRGLALIREYHPKVIWTTYPIHSSLILSDWLSRMTGVPRVVDLRDPIDIGHSGIHQRILRHTERRAIVNSAACVFTTEVMRQRYLAKYGDFNSERFHVIPNGFDPEMFESYPMSQDNQDRRHKPLTLLHAGSVYPGVDPRFRGPGYLFEALANGISSGSFDRESFRLRFLGSGADSAILAEAARFGVADRVICEPALPLAQALSEMSSADGLLLLQGQGFEGQIPAKIYEYMRLRRPVLSLCSIGGETWNFMEKHGAGYCAPLDRSEPIQQLLKEFFLDMAARKPRVAPESEVRKFSRLEQVGMLAKILDSIRS